MPALHGHHQAAKNQFLHHHHHHHSPVDLLFNKKGALHIWITLGLKLVVYNNVFQFHDCTFFNFLITSEIKVTQALFTFCKDVVPLDISFSCLTNWQARGHNSKPNVKGFTRKNSYSSQPRINFLSTLTLARIQVIIDESFCLILLNFQL